MDTTTPPGAMEVKQGGRRQRKPQNNMSVTGQNRTAESGQGGQRQGEGGDNDSDDEEWKRADDKPFINRVKYFLGVKCQSTIWNDTDKVVYAILTDRTIETVYTNTTTMNMNPTIAGNSAGSAGGTHTNRDVRGPTPPQMSPIPARRNRRFNLDSSDYYLTYYTIASGRNVFHEVNVKVKRKNDYVIEPEYLDYEVELAPLLEEEITRLVLPNHA